MFGCLYVSWLTLAHANFRFVWLVAPRFGPCHARARFPPDFGQRETQETNFACEPTPWDATAHLWGASTHAGERNTVFFLGFFLGWSWVVECGDVGRPERPRKFGKWVAHHMAVLMVVVLRAEECRGHAGNARGGNGGSAVHGGDDEMVGVIK